MAKPRIHNEDRPRMSPGALFSSFAAAGPIAGLQCGQPPCTDGTGKMHGWEMSRLAPAELRPPSM